MRVLTPSLAARRALWAHLWHYRYFFRAFPEASVDFKVTRADALERARAFAAGQGFSLQGYQSAIVFNVDDDTKTFLERESWALSKPIA